MMSFDYARPEAKGPSLKAVCRWRLLCPGHVHGTPSPNCIYGTRRSWTLSARSIRWIVKATPHKRLFLQKLSNSICINYVRLLFLASRWGYTRSVPLIPQQEAQKEGRRQDTVPQAGRGDLKGESHTAVAWDDLNPLTRRILSSQRSGTCRINPE